MLSSRLARPVQPQSDVTITMPMRRSLPLLLVCGALALLPGPASAASGIAPAAQLKAQLGDSRARLASRRQEIFRGPASGTLSSIGIEASAGVGAGLWAGIGARTVRGTTTYALYLSPRLKLGLGLGAKLAAERQLSGSQLGAAAASLRAVAIAAR